jgi:hypothetical protein
MKHGYDSTAGTALEWRQIVPTTTPEVIGCYKNGRFANEVAARTAFPHAVIVTYDVNGSRPDADILDIEPGDASPPAAPGWSRKYKGSLPHPGLYTSASSIAAVVSAMLDAGFSREQFLIQSAHYTFTEHICGPGTCGFPQADATQYADKGLHGQNTDLNVFSDQFFGDPTPAKLDPHYDWLENKSFLLFGNRYSERATVIEYDKLRAWQTTTRHPNRARLAVLRARLYLLAGRLWSVGRKLPDRPASWGVDHRGARYQALIHRAQGKRLV